MRTEKIQGKYVTLRIAQAEDAEFTLAIRQDDNNTKYIPKLNVDVNQQKKWINSQADSKDSYFFVIERNNGERIGTFSLYNIENDHGETGRLILKGSPIESVETCVLFHDFCFDQAGMNYLTSEIEDGNMAALGLAERLGGKEQGTSVSNNGIQIKKMRASKSDYLLKREKLIKIVDRFAARVDKQ